MKLEDSFKELERILLTTRIPEQLHNFLRGAHKKKRYPITELENILKREGWPTQLEANIGAIEYHLLLIRIVRSILSGLGSAQISNDRAIIRMSDGLVYFYAEEDDRYERYLPLFYSAQTWAIRHRPS